MHAFMLSIVAYMLTWVALASSTKYTPVIEIQGGSIRGVVKTLTNNKQVRKYLGIPYAKADRFERPVAPESWTGVKDVTSFGKICYQHINPPPFGYEFDDMSEDCLNLNVYAPYTQTSELLPVMVWIHGGGFVANSNRLSEGSYLATLGEVVVVSINYRLCEFGFLSTREYGLEGNYGLYDQLKALKWVQTNIDKFGGDPNRVTIFGNSAGGVSISILSMSPLARGLFKYAIMQSGVANMPAVAYTDYQDKAVLGDFAKEKFGCTDTNMKQCLKGVNAVDFVNNGYGHGSFYLPVIDGEFLTGDPLNLLKNQDTISNAERVLMGVADDDGSCGTNAIPTLSNGYVEIFNVSEEPSSFTQLEYLQLVRQVFTTVDDTLDTEYLRVVNKNYNAKESGITNRPDQVRRILLDVLTDVLFTAPAVAQADSYVRRNIPTYFYQVQYGLPMSDYFTVPSVINAYHETEKFMVFGYALKSQSQGHSIGARLSRQLIKMWSNFAKTGDPNGPQTLTSQVQWPLYNLSKKKFLAIKPSMEVQRNLRPEQVAVWNTILPLLKHESDSSLGLKTKSLEKKKSKKNKKIKKEKAKHKIKPLLKPFGTW